jgi:hypothetical protein
MRRASTSLPAKSVRSVRSERGSRGAIARIEGSVSRGPTHPDSQAIGGDHKTGRLWMCAASVSSSRCTAAVRLCYRTTGAIRNPMSRCHGCVSRERSRTLTIMSRGCLLASPPRGRYHRRSMNEFTQLLSALEHGDPHAASRLLPLACEEMRSSPPTLASRGEHCSDRRLPPQHRVLLPLPSGATTLPIHFLY